MVVAALCLQLQAAQSPWACAGCVCWAQGWPKVSSSSSERVLRKPDARAWLKKGPGCVRSRARYSSQRLDRAFASLQQKGFGGFRPR